MPERAKKSQAKVPTIPAPYTARKGLTSLIEGDAPCCRGRRSGWGRLILLLQISRFHERRGTPGADGRLISISAADRERLGTGRSRGAGEAASPRKSVDREKSALNRINFRLP